MSVIIKSVGLCFTGCLALVACALPVMPAPTRRVDLYAVPTSYTRPADHDANYIPPYIAPRGFIPGVGCDSIGDSPGCMN